MNKILVFIGLGNPGKKYQKNRHNVGFLALDFFIKRMQQKYAIDPVQDLKFSSIINIFKINDTKLFCVFPLTFMNNSGVAVKQIVDYLKIKDFKASLLVMYDDMDISLSDFRLKFDGGDGGHNGIKSIIHYIGKDFYRLRIGISRPPDKDYKNYVLQDFSPEELIKLNQVLLMISDVLENIIKDGIELTTSKLGIFLMKKQW
ncbi:MAG: aminoacyl-tRNA hydrolase [bacterium]